MLVDTCSGHVQRSHWIMPAPMEGNAMTRRLMTLSLFGLALAGCASSSKVMMGQARTPIDPSQVRIYNTAPVGSQEIAQLEATSGTGFGTQGQTDAAVARLKREAAAIGANGVVLMGVGSQRSGGGVSFGAGNYGGHVGAGLGIGIPTTRKHAAGVAIWVPPGTQAQPSANTIGPS